MSFEERVSQHNTGDAKTTTEKVLKSYRLNEIAYVELFPVVEDRVRHLLRSAARGQEHEPRFRGGTIRRASLRGPQPLKVDDFRNIRVRLFNGEVKRWGALTIREHEERIANLNIQVAGTIRTIERHRWAIQQIEDHHVRCLDQIPGEELRREEQPSTAR